MKQEIRFLAAIEKREEKARGMVGELMREGKKIYYITAGRYKEGTRANLIAFLLRNGYA